MPTTDIANRDLTAIHDRRRSLLERLDEARLEEFCPVTTELVHHVVDGGLSSRVLDRLESAASSALETTPHAPQTAWALCRARWEADDWDGVRHLARRVLDRPDWMSQTGWARTLVRAAWADLLGAELGGPFLTAIEGLRVRVCRDEGPLSLVADLAHLDAYRSLVHEGDTGTAASSSRLAAANYRHLGEPANETKARIFLARTLLVRGELAAARSECRRAVESSRRLGNVSLLIHALNALGTVEHRRGEFTVALSRFEGGRRLAEEFDEGRWRFALQANRARTLATQGNWRAAEMLLEETIAKSTAPQAAHTLAVFEEYRGIVALAAGRADEALARFDRCQLELDAASIRSYEKWEVLLRRAEALLELHRFAESYELAVTGLSGLLTSGDVLEEGHLLRVRGLAALQIGRPTEALSAIDGAVAALRRVGDRFTLARTLLDRAEIESRSPEVREADVLEAIALLRPMGVVGLIERAERLRADLETDVRRRASLGAAAPAELQHHDGVIAASSSMRQLLREARVAATSFGPVLLQGETGTGKEVVARYLHRSSRCAGGPFVPVNCAAIPESLFEREFFGHKRGAFTGADRDASGLVEAADGGTLFLDEVGEMPLSLQPKLLRLLQEGTFRRVGETKERDARLRIVAATNRPLLELASAGEFREDLYYRLSCFELRIDPLRDREEDMVQLAHFFLERETERTGRRYWMERAVWQHLRRHRWPGNVRELESAIVSGCARAEGDGCIGIAALPPHFRIASTVSRRVGGRRSDLATALESYERRLILQALHQHGHSRSATARALGIGRNTLYEKMKRLGIKPEKAESVV